MSVEKSQDRLHPVAMIAWSTVGLVFATVVSYFLIQAINDFMEGGVKVRTATAARTFFVTGPQKLVELSEKVGLEVSSINTTADQGVSDLDRVTVVDYTLFHDDARNLKKGSEFVLVHLIAGEENAIPPGIVLSDPPPRFSRIDQSSGGSTEVPTASRYPSADNTGFRLDSELSAGFLVQGSVLINTSNKSEFEEGRILLRPVIDGLVQLGPLQPARRFAFSWATLVFTMISVGAVYAFLWMLLNTYGTHNYSTGSVIWFALFALVGLKRLVPERFRQYQNAKRNPGTRIGAEP